MVWKTLTIDGLKRASDNIKKSVQDWSNANFVKKTDVDSSISATSANPVQNKVVSTELNKKLDKAGGDISGALDVAGDLSTGGSLKIGPSNGYGVMSYSKTDGLTISDSNGVEDQVALVSDLSQALANKQNKLTAGANITIDSDNTISAKDTTYGIASATSPGLMPMAHFTKVDSWKSMTVTLPIGDWTDRIQAVSVVGMTPTATVVVSPAIGYHETWYDSGICTYAQSNNTLTFRCTTAPNTNIVVNVMMAEL